MIHVVRRRLGTRPQQPCCRKSALGHARATRASRSPASSLLPTSITHPIVLTLQGFEKSQLDGSPTFGQKKGSWREQTKLCAGQSVGIGSKDVVEEVGGVAPDKESGRRLGVGLVSLLAGAKTRGHVIGPLTAGGRWEEGRKWELVDARRQTLVPQLFDVPWLPSRNQVINPSLE